MIVTMILEKVAEIHLPLAESLDARLDAAVNSVLPMVQESTRLGYQSQAKEPVVSPSPPPDSTQPGRIPPQNSVQSRK